MDIDLKSSEHLQVVAKFCLGFCFGLSIDHQFLIQILSGNHEKTSTCGYLEAHMSLRLKMMTYDDVVL